MQRRPRWDDTKNDLSQYRLSFAEQINRRASLVSKNKEKAREELSKKQEMLKQGKIPKEVKQVIAPPPKKFTANSATIAKNPKNSNNRPSTAKPVPQEPKPQVKPSNVKTTKVGSFQEQYQTLTKLDEAMKQLESAMMDSLQPVSHQSSLQQVPSQHFSLEEPLDYTEPNELSQDSIFCLSPDTQTPVQQSFEKIPENSFRSILEEATGPTEPYEPPEDDYASNLAKLLEDTKKDLENMQIPDYEVQEFHEEPPCEYDQDLIPRQFDLKPVKRSYETQHFAPSLAISNHVKNIEVNFRKFII